MMGPSTLSEIRSALPQMDGGEYCSGHRVSLEHRQHLPADADVTAPGIGGHPSGRTPIRQELFWYEGDAEPLWWDAEDIFADAGLECGAPATPESPALDQHGKAMAKVQRLAGLQSKPSPAASSDLTGVSDWNKRGQRQGVFTCAICFDEHSLEDCYIASACGHCMCRDAAREVVLGAVRSRSFPVPCPICQTKPEPRCILCTEREAAIAAAQDAGQEGIPSGPSAWCCTLDADAHLLLTVEEEEEYLERSLKAARNSCANLVPCPEPDCEGMAVAGQEDESPGLKCDACGHKWCGKCNVAWHSNRSCDDYQRECGEKEADKGLEEYRKAHRVINCPTCKHGIERISGCDHMMCSRCATPFCWRCGGKRPSNCACS